MRGEALRGSPRGENAQSHRIIIADRRRSLKRYFIILGMGLRRTPSPRARLLTQQTRRLFQVLPEAFPVKADGNADL